MDDTSKYLALFVSEANAHVAELWGGIGSLCAAEFQPQLIDELFRHAHSIKGMAAAMGFEEITALARAAELLLGKLREQRRVPPPPLDQILLAGAARLSEMIRAREVGESLPPAPQLASAIEQASADVA